MPRADRRRSERRERPRDLVVPLLLLQLEQFVLGARAEAGDVGDSVYSSVCSVVCGGVDSRLASVCSNVLTSLLLGFFPLHAIKNN